MLALYGLLSGAAALLLAVLLPVLALVWPRLRRGLWERLSPLPAGEGPAVWVHAASVGEAEAAVPVIEALRARDVAVIATTLTETGRDRLRARVPGLGARLAPADVPGLVHWSVRRAGVRVLALIETELWPNTISAVTGAGGGVVMLGARISDRSYPRYRSLGPLIRPLLRRVARVGARSVEDAERFVALGLPAARSLVIGDLKLDRDVAPAPSSELVDAIGPGPILLGASTHAGEEELLLAAWAELRRAEPELRLVLAPRHPDRSASVIESARRHGTRAGRRSEGAAGDEVVVLDSLGELASLYHHADLVFSGGTLVPVGGHNLIEPVQAGRVVVHGPFTANQRVQVDLLAPLGVLHRVDDAAQLRSTLLTLLADPKRDAAAQLARRALESHRGAATRATGLVLEALGA